MNRSPWMNSRRWRLEEVDGGDQQYPMESHFVVRHTPPDEQDPRFNHSAPTQVCFVRFAVRHTPPDQQDPCFDRRRSVSSILRYARPLPMNRIPFRMWPVKHKAISFVLQYARPCFHRMFHPSPPNEHDDAFHSDPAGWLPMNTTTTLFLRSDQAMYTSPGLTYARVGVRDPARMYVRGRIYFLAPWPLYVRVHATCAPLHRPVCTYMFATRMTTLRTLRPGGSRLSGTSLRAKM